MIYDRERNIFVVGAVIRVCLLLYGDWQDRNFEMKYTDIDYYVYSEGASYVLKGQSPFLRHTYRYTPLLAYALTPNAIFPWFGKMIFIIGDMLTGVIISKLLKISGFSSWFLALWLWNPLVCNISTRGSSDSIASFLILLTLYYLKTEKTYKAAIIYGLAVHFRIYPIIYALLFYLSIDSHKKKFFSQQRIFFGLISGGVFLFLIFVFYLVYGYEFLYETYLYHFLRKDNRHNFSLYFYLLYLTYSSYAKWVGLLAFIPQWGLIIYISLSKLPLNISMLSLTFVFVVFNKVCTAQYFIWYATLLPISLPGINISRWKAFFLVLPWILTENNWIYWTYKLEFLGENVFLQIWLASFLFFIANVRILTNLIQASPTNHLKST